MRRSLFQWAGMAGPSLLLVSCSSVLGYESDYSIGAGGEAGSTAQGGQSGQAGKPDGIAGRGAAGSVGASGASSGGGGVQSGGTAGAAGMPGAGGLAGMPGTGGLAGTSGTSGAGGTNAGASGASGATPGGSAGSGVAGSAGAPQAGAGGSAGGKIGGGASGAAGAGGGSAGAGGGANPTDCSVLYVSPTGLDTNDGCAPGKPKKAPANALASLGSTTKEIRLCAGSYPSEGLELTKAISLRGSFDCATWARASFDSTSTRTTIIAAAGAKAALVVSGVAVTRAVEIEGVSLVGGDGDGTSRGVWITKGAAPTIRDSALIGGQAVSAELGSVGAYVDQGGAPRLSRDLVRGGTGTTKGDAVGSAGLYLASDAGLVDVVENRIEGGKGSVQGSGVPTAAFFAEPLLFGLVGDHALVDNVFVGGEGNDVSEKVFLLSAAVYLVAGSTASTSLTLRGGQILGGTTKVGMGAGTDRSVAAAAVYSTGHDALRVESARVYGGDGPSFDGFAAGFLLGSGSTQVIGSLVHGGGARTSTKLTRPFNLNGQGSPGSLELIASTVLTGQQTGGANTVYSYGATKVVLRSNFIVQQSGYAPVLQVDGACGPTAGSTFEANAFAFTRAGDPLLQINQDGCNKLLVSVADLQAAFPGAEGNLRITPMGGLSPDLTLACNGGASCLEKLFVGFEAASFGLSQVLSKTDGDLSPRLPALCPVALGGKLFAASPTDLLGKARPGARTSMGAFQVGEGICP